MFIIFFNIYLYRVLVAILVQELDTSGYWNVVFLIFSEFLFMAMCFWLRVAGVLTAIVEHACLLLSSLYSGGFEAAAATSPMSILPLLEEPPIWGQL